jgi:putative transposase
MLLLSILYRLLRCLLGLTAVLMRRDLSKDVELLVLRQENTVLRPWVPNWSSTAVTCGIAGRRLPRRQHAATVTRLYPLKLG